MSTPADRSLARVERCPPFRKLLFDLLLELVRELAENGILIRAEPSPRPFIKAVTSQFFLPEVFVAECLKIRL